MSEYEYTAGLYYMKGTEKVSFETLNITASNDDDAVRKAIEWRIITLTIIDRETWLQVHRDGTEIYSKGFGRI